MRRLKDLSCGFGLVCEHLLNWHRFDGGPCRAKVYALDLVTGAVLQGWPVDVESGMLEPNLARLLGEACAPCPCTSGTT